MGAFMYDICRGPKIDGGHDGWSEQKSGQQRSLIKNRSLKQILILNSQFTTVDRK